MGHCYSRSSSWRNPLQGGDTSGSLEPGGTGGTCGGWSGWLHFCVLCCSSCALMLLPPMRCAVPLGKAASGGPDMPQEDVPRHATTLPLHTRHPHPHNQQTCTLRCSLSRPSMRPVEPAVGTQRPRGILLAQFNTATDQVATELRAHFGSPVKPTQNPGCGSQASSPCPNPPA